jgi:hypothetical protein
MNIYLDIDGVLLANESHAALYADKLLQTILQKYPDSTYWLSTHCWKGENRATKVVAPHLQPGTIALLGNIKPTVWGEMKTDGIDFTQPFLWLDDDLWPEEEAALNDHDAMDNFILIDLVKNPNQLEEIARTL